jgi:ssRNA-specific RNase YbeY (16S rRNA maturation enzyme)
VRVSGGCHISLLPNRRDDARTGMVLKHVAPFSRKRLEKTWRRACARLGLDAAETSVALVSAKRMTELHERYKPHKRGPTDV